MAYVPVPKDLSKIKTKVAFNLTKRQIVSSSKLETWGMSASTAIFSLPFQLVPVFSA